MAANPQTESRTSDKDLSTGSGEKRRHPRYGVSSRALLSVLGSKDAVPGVISDLSQGGLQLTAEAGFPVGEIIRAEIEDEVFVGVVSYSKKSRDGYVIGTEMLHSIKRTHLDTLVREWGVPQ